MGNVFDLEKIERIVTDNYCVDGMRPVVSIIEDFEEFTKLEINFIRYTNRFTDKEIPNYIIINVNNESHLVEDIWARNTMKHDNVFNPNFIGVDGEYEDRVVDVYDNMVNDIDNGILFL